MIEHSCNLNLPPPWKGEQFKIERFGDISFFVGPNGSGKSRFADSLKLSMPTARFLSTDRLQGMGPNPFAGFSHDMFGAGLSKNQFGNLKGTRHQGSGIDTFVILEERPDIRVIVEATLSSLFNRKISLEWESGNLVPKARLITNGSSYRLDREECHGIRELLVLITHLYNDEHPFLIIDEPELNLHPQFQAFFMQEVRKIAGQHVPGKARKGIILITHSPFILDLRSIEDLQSVFCFYANHSTPKFIGEVQEKEKIDLASLIPRLNVHHKQLFFADHPIFVEGSSDSQLIETIQERRNVSISGAGSCLIDVGGCEELTKYVKLCGYFGKEAYFLFDLDSLFIGSLRKCVANDGSISNFLANLGLGNNFGKYCGELERVLTKAINKIEDSASDESICIDLKRYFNRISEADNDRFAKKRLAILIELAVNKGELTQILAENCVRDIEGRFEQIKTALRSQKIFLLSNGALEHYLPSYTGDRFKLEESAKKGSFEF